MQSRRDQVDARSDELARLSGALMAGVGDLPESPARRDGLTGVAGAVTAAVVAAAVLIVGAFSGAAASTWRVDGSLVVDKDSGSRYLYRDGVLHPVLNLASLRIALGTQPEPRLVPGRKLRELPRGEAVGVPGLPDTLPAAAGLNRGTWRVCPAPLTATPAGGDGAAQAPAATVAVTLGASALTPLPDGRGALVTSGGRDYLLWRGTRLAIAGTTGAALLGWAGQSKRDVPAELLDAVPAGPDLVAADLPDRGREAGDVVGRPSRVGDLYVATIATGEAGFVRLRDGLAPITPLDLQLEQARPDASEPRRLTPGQVAGAPRSVRPYRDAPFPATVPSLVAQDGEGPGSPGGAVCVQYPALDPARAAAHAVDLVLGETAPAGVRSVPGTGRLARPLDGGVTVVIGEDARALPVTDPSALGYADAVPELVPPSFLRLVPQVAGVTGSTPVPSGPGSTRTKEKP